MILLLTLLTSTVVWRVDFFFSLLLFATVMTKQLDAAVWMLDNNKLASFFATGELPVLLLRTRALQHCPVGRLKMNKKGWACQPLQCTVKHSCPASPTFLVVSVFYTPSPLLLILPLLRALLSLFFSSAYSPVTPTIISPSSSWLFPQNTALSPVILF